MPLGLKNENADELYLGGEFGPGSAWGSNPRRLYGEFFWEHQLQDTSWKERDGNPLVPDAEMSDAAFVTSLYAKYYHRSPDAAGLAFWVNEIVTARKPRADVESAFAASPDIIKTADAVAGSSVPRRQPPPAASPSSGSNWVLPVVIVAVVLLLFKS
jgi:hypothetical protein